MLSSLQPLWNAAHQLPLSSISGSLLKFMYIELVMLSNCLILCCPHLLLPSIFPVSGSFPLGHLFASGGQSFGASAILSVLPMSIQGWFPLGLTGLIFLLSKGLSRVFSSTAIRKHPFFGVETSLWPNSHIHTPLDKLLVLYQVFPHYVEACLWKGGKLTQGWKAE